MVLPETLKVAGLSMLTGLLLAWDAVMSLEPIVSFGSKFVVTTLTAVLYVLKISDELRKRKRARNSDQDDQ